MRILILTPLTSPWGRGVIGALAEAGAEIAVVAPGADPPAPGPLDDEPLPASVRFTRIAPVATGPRRHLSALPALRRLLRRQRPDVLLTLYGGGFAALAAASGHRPYVVYVMGSDVWQVRGARRRIARSTYSRAALVLANGRSLAAEAERLAPRATVRPLHHGIRIERFPVRRPGGPPRFLVTRAYDPVYNQQQIAAALRLAPEAHVTFASGSPGWAELRDRIGPLPGVRFLGGVVPSAMPALMAEHTHYLSTARTDGTPTSLLEAMCTGLHPVMADIPAARDWIDPATGNGTLVPLDDAAALAAVLSNPPVDSHTVRAANRARVLNECDQRTNMQRLVEMLSSIVGSTRAHT